MENVYESCPVFDNERFLLRQVRREDAGELLEVYSDKNALPFFNSDNCDGDNFYYPTIEKMESAIDFWISSYEKKWFVRWAVIDKSSGKAIGTIELFRREWDDDLDGVGVLRLDVGSSYEEANTLHDIFSLIIPPAYGLFGCDEVITKVPIYAVERSAAAERFGFVKTDSCLKDKNGIYTYFGYRKVHR